ncbi:peptidylprolyl isomerase [Yeosuana marina]|uniref:peptidylprolyl isomerase n=1 Tax=Yeosuana marina TaxID=1565536 RepID=UPI0030ECF85B|tara:strand:- start:6622 stop:8574 length:1953 start_codon:yes stop_codon:yes gene_type:complete
MTFKYFPLLALFLFYFKASAQSNSEEVLFTIQDEPIYSSEFIKVYNKNLNLVEDESQNDLNSYLTLFIDYKLKIKEAYSLGLQNKASYKRELDGYRKQLAENFINDTKVTDDLVKEAYNRISNEVKVSHILIRLPENASPQDTLVAYNNIVKLRNRALKEGFDKVRKEVHNGQTVFGEDLGYFSAFRMVYPFESAAYHTNVGDISKPFRTRFGYHILKVYDKRKSRGEITVAHIMVTNKPEDSISNSSETRINDIYKKIKQGEDFEALAKQFSEDPSSSNKGGKLAPFSGGQLSSQVFEDMAFSLKNIGDVSKPIKTKYGWHIIKLLNKKPIQPFQDMRPELEMKVKRDDRSHLIDDALFDKLKIKYKVTDEQPALGYFESILNDTYFKKTWEQPEDFQGSKPLIKIGEKQLTFQDFANQLLKSQRIAQKASFKELVAKEYNMFLKKNLIKYQEDHLETENKDFASIISEYREGLLLFDLMESTIWNTSKTDTTEIKTYYNSHKDNYRWPDRIDAIVASSANEKILKKAAKLLKKNIDLETIKQTFNTNNKVNVMFTVGVMDNQNQALPNNFPFKKGISKIYNHNNSYVVVQVKDVFPSSQQSFEEAKGKIISDYQTDKEHKWLQGLKDKYKVVINEEALNRIKLKLNKQ